MLNRSLTIVLPVYNGESRLRRSVVELLELASDLTNQFSILVIDDGSTDHTYEVAGELASRYPQVSVRRHRTRRGLGPTIDAIRRHVRSEVVIVHDGVTPIDTNHVRTLWRRHLLEQPTTWRKLGAQTAPTTASINDLGDLRSLHESLAKAHQRVLGFQWVTPLRPDAAHTTDEPWAAPVSAPADKRLAAEPAGVGRIPPLPRPNFLSALAEFALGQ
ncbi:MAG: hypothetical protein A2W31_18985 [Planctomycetes bacterium RBG_16_64_10]|nr:MAG: hypothetical protein A2W31_18985 [Planctomycetes bacterium RBG_16_64_10]